MKKYWIIDLAHGLMAEHVEVFAESPSKALRAAGYSKAERDYTGKRGNAIVQGRFYRGGSYVYFATK